MIKSFLKRHPKIEKVIVKTKRIFVPEQSFVDSTTYWEARYKRRGDSGPGSYNRLAEFKADTINGLIERENIKSMIDWGCGDGNLVKFYKVEEYLGLDISSTVIHRCSKIFKNDQGKKFLTIANYDMKKAQLSISLDVIFHLIEDDIFESYMKNLFDSSSQFVLIYSSNTDEGISNSPHFKHRKFTDWVEKNKPDYTLKEVIKNKYPYNGDSSSTSVSDFYLFTLK